jgi:predicted permease
VSDRARGVALYRRLLALLPADFRRRYGDEMSADLAERLRDRGGSPAARAAWWLGALADLVATAARERGRVARTPRHRPQEPGRSPMDIVRAEVAWALRSLRRSPVVAALAVLTLGLGIGASTAVFSAVHKLLLEPLPYRAADRLVLVWPEQAFNKTLVRRVGRAMPALQGISGISNWTFALTGGQEPEEVLGSLVSANHFELLGIQPALGRVFLPEEGRRGRNGVVILGHELWQRRFGGDPGILGRRIPLAGDDLDARTVIGVMAKGYQPLAGAEATPQLWVPYAEPESEVVGEDSSWYVNWRVGRLAPGATMAQARAQLRAEARRLHEEGFNIVSGEAARTADVVPLSYDREAGVATPLWLLMGSVGLVLLIACANVANLLLARGEGRERELTVRRALGAGSVAIARQLFAESLLLGLAGGALGVVLAYLLVRVLAGSAATVLPRLGAVTIDATALGFCLAASLCAAVLFGALPALRGARRSAAASLRAGGPGALGPRRGRPLPSWLVASQVALAVVVAVASGLMLRSLRALYAVDPGVESRGVLALRLVPPPSKYRDSAANNALYDRLFDRLAGLPGVRAIGGIQLLPLVYGNWSFPSYVEGHPVAPGDTAPYLSFRVIRPGYFETLRIPLLSGRHLRADDGIGDAPDLAVVNETLARRFWPDEPSRAPLGKEIRLFGPDGNPVRIVGVVGDVHQFALDRAVAPELYVSSQEWTWPVSLVAVLRTDGDPMALAPAVRAAVWSVDRDVPISDLRPMSEVVTRSAGMRRVLGLLLTVFGLLALLLGSVGVFGVTAYTVARRLPELGLRKALGATGGQLLAATMREGLRPVALGVVAGAAGALAAGRFIASQLFGVTAGDPTTLATVALVLLAVGALATALPAWRAGAVDPMRVLRRE